MILTYPPNHHFHPHPALFFPLLSSPIDLPVALHILRVLLGLNSISLLSIQHRFFYFQIDGILLLIPQQLIADVDLLHHQIVEVFTFMVHFHKHLCLKICCVAKSLVTPEYQCNLGHPKRAP